MRNAASRTALIVVFSNIDSTSTLVSRGRKKAIREWFQQSLC
jgi:hypothetical protein